MQTQHTKANLIAEEWIKNEPLAIPAGLKNEKGYGTILGFEVHALLQRKSEQAARNYYRKVLKFGS